MLLILNYTKTSYVFWVSAQLFPDEEEEEESKEKEKEKKQRVSRNTLVTLVHYIFVVHTRVAAKSHFQSKCKHLNHRTNKQSDGKRVFLGLQRRGCGQCLVTNRQGF